MRPELLSRRRVLDLAWPIMLANAAVPLLGIVDTAVIGRMGRLQDLGAIALGSLVFNFIYWSFGFLRMGTTGFVAQASGRGDELEVRTAVARPLLMGLCLGVALVLFQRPIRWAAFRLLSGEAAVEAAAGAYLRARIWGAPATLGTFAVMGAFIGLGKSRHLLVVQVCVSGLNMALDVWFVTGLDWGVEGIARGTAIAEWCGFSLALGLLWRLLSARRADGEPFVTRAGLRDWSALATTLRANADIMLRTLCLLLGFGFFTDRGAAFGEEVLAGNHVLLQFISLSAFFLDGFAHVAEPMVGNAIGRGDLQGFDRAVRLTSELAALTSVCLAGLLWLAGPGAIGMLTDLPAVRAMAIQYLPFAGVYVLLSFAAFQLDGIFIGATRTRAMRNASALSLLVFLAIGFPASHIAANVGLWLAFVAYVVARALTLGAHYPALRASASSLAH